MKTVIDVADLWKKYRLGIIGTGTLRHDFERWWHRVRGKPDPHAKIGEEMRNPKRESQNPQSAIRDPQFEEELGDDEIWALRGVSFQVKQGEILGIIGPNGAGKSTLLKILSRVTSPTKGEVRIKGRIASLLEVGTGFHPELTGRENIFLNGAILGMTKAEIRGKLDEIVDFAGVETYIDTPVKRYSSGMHVRLAFAVAAHLDPEILIIDEVLAVGDSDFQKKCVGKMRDVSKGGRTVLFVSHNLGIIQTLCDRGILLSNGALVQDASIESTVSAYLLRSRATNGRWEASGISMEVSFLDASGTPIDCWDYGAEMTVSVVIRSERPLQNPAVDLVFYSESGTKVFAVQSDKLPGSCRVTKDSRTCLEFAIQNIGFAIPSLNVDVGIRRRGQQEYIAWWERVQTVAMGTRKLGSYHVPDAILAPPVRLLTSESQER